MTKPINLAKNIMIALHQFGVEYDMNVSGWGPKVVTITTPVEGAISSYQEVRRWLDETVTFVGDGKERRVTSPCGKEVKIFQEGNHVAFFVTIERLIYPLDEDYEEWAWFYGFSAFEEAQYNGCDMPWSREEITILVPGNEVENFLKLVVPYCW